MANLVWMQFPTKARTHIHIHIHIESEVRVNSCDTVFLFVTSVVLEKHRRGAGSIDSDSAECL